MQHAQPPVVIFVVVIPLLYVACIFFTIWSLISLYNWIRRLRLQAFAAREGLSFDRKTAPISLPSTATSPALALQKHANFLHGTRHGFEVFACDFRNGTGRSSVSNTMVAIRAHIHDPDGKTFKGSTLMHPGDWTFVVPRGDGLLCSPRRIRKRWDLLTAAAQTLDPARVD